MIANSPVYVAPHETEAVHYNPVEKSGHPLCYISQAHREGSIAPSGSGQHTMKSNVLILEVLTHELPCICQHVETHNHKEEVRGRQITLRLFKAASLQQRKMGMTKAG